MEVADVRSQAEDERPPVARLAQGLGQTRFVGPLVGDDPQVGKRLQSPPGDHEGR